jgi:hypothetical protein
VSKTRDWNIQISPHGGEMGDLARIYIYIFPENKFQNLDLDEANAKFFPEIFCIRSGKDIPTNPPKFKWMGLGSNVADLTNSTLS